MFLSAGNGQAASVTVKHLPLTHPPAPAQKTRQEPYEQGLGDRLWCITGVTRVSAPIQGGHLWAPTLT